MTDHPGPVTRAPDESATAYCARAFRELRRAWDTCDDGIRVRRRLDREAWAANARIRERIERERGETGAPADPPA